LWPACRRHRSPPRSCIKAPSPPNLAHCHSPSTGAILVLSAAAASRPPPASRGFLIPCAGRRGDPPPPR
jgi:hypothetical protein